MCPTFLDWGRLAQIVVAWIEPSSTSTIINLWFYITNFSLEHLIFFPCLQNDPLGHSSWLAYPKMKLHNLDNHYTRKNILLWSCFSMLVCHGFLDCLISLEIGLCFAFKYPVPENLQIDFPLNRHRFPHIFLKLHHLLPVCLLYRQLLTMVKNLYFCFQAFLLWLILP